MFVFEWVGDIYKIINVRTLNLDILLIASTSSVLVTVWLRSM